MKKYRIGLIGFAHSHMGDNVRSFAGLDVEWVASADIKPLVEPINDSMGTRYGIMNFINEKLGIKKIYDDFRQMLNENEMDIALVCCENAFHGYVCEEILRRGIHVIVEKPMATTMGDTLRIAQAAKDGNAKIIVNWPYTWWPGVRKAHELCEAGEIGKIFKITYRNADSLGPLSYGQQVTDYEKGFEWWHQAEAGGGALLDYCCYGACMSRWFLGTSPISAYGMKANFNSHYGNAEDYATITVRYPEAVSIVEGSWTTLSTGIPNGPIVYGLEGTLVVDGPEVRIYKTRHKTEPDKVFVADPLPENRNTLGKEVLHHLETGEALHPTLDLPVNLDAMSILDAGIRSAQSGKMENVLDRYSCIGR